MTADAPPGATALVVIDMQNSFLHPEGENYWPGAEAVAAPVLALIAAAEAAGAPIVHVADRHRPGFADAEQRRLPPHCIAGGFDAAFFAGFGPAGRRREIELVKRRYSAFFATDLALFLREQGIDRLVICGVKTNLCVRSTAQDAFAHGFGVVIPREATASNRPHLALAALEDLERYFGRVVALDAARGMFA